eukprot:3227319-Pyramimonas_sp.AAC.1
MGKVALERTGITIGRIMSTAAVSVELGSEEGRPREDRDRDSDDHRGQRDRDRDRDRWGGRRTCSSSSSGWRDNHEAR